MRGVAVGAGVFVGAAVGSEVGDSVGEAGLVGEGSGVGTGRAVAVGPGGAKVTFGVGMGARVTVAVGVGATVGGIGVGVGVASAHEATIRARSAARTRKLRISKRHPLSHVENQAANNLASVEYKIASYYPLNWGDNRVRRQASDPRSLITAKGADKVRALWTGNSRRWASG